jgi:2-polyprenyl-6-methoxyphenol hydroxylase-like FAD-dependent oxidoreductase
METCMRSIGIVGSGIAGLHLGLKLQQAGVATTMYSDRTPEQIRAGRIPNFVARFGHTQARERALGVDHWSTPEFTASTAHFRINGEQPLTFCGTLAEPMSIVDMRLYLPALHEAFAARGGRVVIANVQGPDLHGLAKEHDLIVVASGRASLTDLFPRIPERSPYTAPLRRLFGGLFHGVRFPEPLGVSYNVSPGHGELLQTPFATFGGRVNSILFECIPGGDLERIVDMRYDDDPYAFEATVLDLLQEHAPVIYERVDRRAFRLTRSLDLLQGAITPVVRHGYTRLTGDRFAVALGDVRSVVDPIVAQGANTASQSAWLLGEEILAGGPFDEAFCRRVDERIWEYARPATEWTNATLQPPPQHAIDVFTAAAQNQAIADEITNNFGAPARNWAIFESPEGARAFLDRAWKSPAKAALPV